MSHSDTAAWRREHGYSQAKLAQALGIPRQTVIRWERGKTRPMPYLALALAHLLCGAGQTAPSPAARQPTIPRVNDPSLIREESSSVGLPDAILADSFSAPEPGKRAVASFDPDNDDDWKRGT